MVEPGPLKRSADREIMPASYPSDGVVPVERGAREDRIGERTEAEKPETLKDSIALLGV